MILLNPYESRVLTQGQVWRTAPVCWSDGYLAVAGRWIRGLRLSGWSLVHITSGYMMDSLLPEDVDPLDVAGIISFAKHMANVVDWASVTPERVASENDLRVAVRAHAAKWSRARGEE